MTISTVIILIAWSDNSNNWNNIIWQFQQRKKNEIVTVIIKYYFNFEIAIFFKPNNSKIEITNWNHQTISMLK